MYCRKCGAKCKDGAKFCSKCGTPLQSNTSKNDETLSSADLENTAAAGTGGWFQRNKKIAWIILIVIIAAVVVIISVSVARHYSKAKDMSPEEHLDLGIRYYEDGDYQEAVTEFTDVLDVEQDMQAYRYLAASYLGLDETEGVNGEADGDTYVELAGEVYEEAVAYALDIYDESGELPDGTKDLYDDAIIYADQHDREGPSRLSDLSSLIESNDEPGETQTTDEEIQEENPPSEEDVGDLLETFKDWADDMLRLYYSSYASEGADDLSNYGAINAPEAYAVAALALREDRNAPQGDFAYYLDGNFYTMDEYNALSMDLKTDAREYIPLSTSYYEEYLQNLFGEEYSLDDFKEYEDQVNDTVIEGEDGQFYVVAGDYINEGVDISIVDFSDTPDENGLYTVIAEYTTHWAEGEPDSIDYMLYQIAPDDSSAYGCRIVGMVPAGDGEVEDAFKSQVEVKDTDSDEASYMEWQQLYADYIEQIYLEEETTAESAYAENPEEWLEDYYYYLIYLNDDDVPELLRCSSADPYRGNTTDYIIYIQDSQVKDQEIANAVFAIRGGYISSFFATGAYMEQNVWRLNEQNELVTELNAYESYEEISINGQDVSSEEHDKKVQEETVWETSGEYTVLIVRDGTLNIYGSDERYASPFATGASSAVTALRDRYIEPI